MIRYIPIYLFIYFTLFVYSLRLAHTNTHAGLNIYICVCSFVDRIIHNNKTIRFHFIFSWTLFFHAFNSIQFVCILTAVHTLYKSKTETYERKKHQNTAFEWVNERASSRIVPGQEGKGMNKRKPVHFNVVAYYSLVRSSVSSFLICLVCLAWLGLAGLGFTLHVLIFFAPYKSINKHSTTPFARTRNIYLLFPFHNELHVQQH